MLQVSDDHDSCCRKDAGYDVCNGIRRQKSV